jgi:LPXTG-motif cell wall-anchored protein
VAAGSVVTAEAASAHATLLTGGAACQSDGTYTVTYTLRNDYNLSESVTLKSSGGGGTLTGLPTTISASPGQPYSSVTVTQSGVPGSSTTAGLTVVGTWSDGYTQTDAALVHLAGDCQPTKPSAPRVTDETCSEANTPQNGSIAVTPIEGITYYYVETDSDSQPTAFEGSSVSLPAGDYTVIAMRGERTVQSWDVTIAAATCTTTKTPPAVTTPGASNPQAEVGATCTQAQVELKNLTPLTTDLPATFQVSVTGEQPKTFTVAAGDTQTGTYTPKDNPYTVTVASGGKTLATATTSHLSCVEAVVIPGAKPPAVAPAVVPAELPHTGAGSLPLALAGGGLLLLGSLLVASTRRRRGDLAA